MPVEGQLESGNELVQRCFCDRFSINISFVVNFPVYGILVYFFCLVTICSSFFKQIASLNSILKDYYKISYLQKFERGIPDIF